MSSDSLIKLAREIEFRLKVEAARKKPKEPPADVKADDLTWLPEHEREYIRQMRQDVNSPFNPPRWVAEPSKWKKAKKAVKAYWDRYDNPYAVIADIYRGPMKGKVKKTKKSD